MVGIVKRMAERKWQTLRGISKRKVKIVFLSRYPWAHFNVKIKGISNISLLKKIIFRGWYLRDYMPLNAPLTPLVLTSPV